MGETQQDQHLSALADELIARGIRFLREVTATKELEALRGAEARISRAEQARTETARRLVDLEAKLVETEAKLAAAEVTASKELEALRSAQARFSQAEQARTETARRLVDLEAKLVETEAKLAAAELVLEEAARAQPVVQPEPPPLGEDSEGEREALLEELQTAVSAQRATIAKRDRTLAEQAAQLEAFRAQLASLGATV
jgi:chromosome segregation ATPase